MMSVFISSIHSASLAIGMGEVRFGWLDRHHEMLFIAIHHSRVTHFVDATSSVGGTTNIHPSICSLNDINGLTILCLLVQSSFCLLVGSTVFFCLFVGCCFGDELRLDVNGDTVPEPKDPMV
jgi:hypothetical protein